MRLIDSKNKGAKSFPKNIGRNIECDYLALAILLKVKIHNR